MSLATFLIIGACPIIALSAEAASKSDGVKSRVAKGEDAISRMREFAKKRQWKELIEAFKDENLTAWPKAAEAFSLRGKAYFYLKDTDKAKQDLKSAGAHSPKNGYFWHDLAGIYKDLLKDDDLALDAYTKAFEIDDRAHTVRSLGWMPISATIEAASILMTKTEYSKALKVLGRYNDSYIQKMGMWGVKILRSYGQVYLGQGREKAAIAKFKAALELEKKHQ